MGSHYQDSYKGILYNITRNGREYYGYLLDSEYSFTSTGDDKYEVEANIRSYIDGIAN